MSLLSNTLDSGQQRAPVAGNVQSNRPAPASQQPNAVPEFNPEVMMDAVKYAVMFQGMKPEQRKKSWPFVAETLISRDPNLANVISPEGPAPSDAELKGFIDPVRKRAFLQTWNPSKSIKGLEEEEIQLLSSLQDNNPLSPKQESLMNQIMNENMDKFGIEEEEEEEEVPEYMKLSGPVKNQVQKEILQLDKDFESLESIYDNFDVDAFTYQGKAEEFLAEQLDRVGLSSEDQQKLLASRIAQRQSIQRMMLMWRKLITGTAGSEREMKDIEKTTLNPNLSPAQAKAALETLYGRIARDREVNRRLLNKGIMLDTTSEDRYSSLFNKERQKVSEEHKAYIERFKKANPGATEIDAIRFKLHKARPAQGAAE